MTAVGLGPPHAASLGLCADFSWPAHSPTPPNIAKASPGATATAAAEQLMHAVLLGRPGAQGTDIVTTFFVTSAFDDAYGTSLFRIEIYLFIGNAVLRLLIELWTVWSGTGRHDLGISERICCLGEPERRFEVP